jgi:transposase
LLEIRGLGVVTLAVLLGELGDLRNYRHWKQVVKMAGLTLVESSSGKKAGPRHISKRGRPLLRKLLFMAALRMFASGLPLHSLYQRLGKTKAGSQVAVAGMRRLLQTLHSLVKHNQSFSQARFDSQPAKPGAKLAA